MTEQAESTEVKRRWAAISIEEQIAVLRRAEANGVELPLMMIPILETVAKIDSPDYKPDPANRLHVTAETTDEEISLLIRAEKRAETRTRYSLAFSRRRRQSFKPLADVLFWQHHLRVKRWHTPLFVVLRRRGYH